MKKLMCFALFASAPAIAFAQKETKPAWSWNIRGEAEVRYDDNILGLSDTEVKALRSTDDPEDDERFMIETPNDIIFNPLIGFGIYHKPDSGMDTNFGMTAATNQYANNTIKDYSEYRVWFRQDLNPNRKHRTTLALGGTRIPSYYLRQLVDDDESVAPNTCNTPDPNDLCHESATYRLTTGNVELTQEIVNRILSAEVMYAYEVRDYNDNFNERDAESDVYTIHLNIYPAKSIAFRIRPWYEHEDRTTEGDIGTSTSFAEDDAGFDSDVYGLELRGLWGKDADHRNTLRGYYQWETKDFTSDNPADGSHFGREDRIKKFGIGYAREMGRHLKLDISGYHRDNDVSTSSSLFLRNVVAVALEFEFGK